MAPEEREDKTLSWQDYWQIALRRRWWILCGVFGIWLMAWSVSWVLPVRYRSETLILVEHQKVPQEYVVSNVSVDLQERLQSMTQQILSRTRLKQIIDEYQIYSDRDRVPFDVLVERMRKDIDIQLVQSPTSRELSSFRVFYTAGNPQRAQQIASKLTSLFIEENLRAQQEQSENTTEFLSSELEQARNSLAVQETKVREFKAQYVGQLPSQTQSNMGILAGLQSQRDGLTAALNRSQQQKLYLESMLGNYRSVDVSTTESGPRSIPAIDQEIARLRNELADAQAQYTEKHPDVVRLKGQLAKAENVKQRLESEAASRQTTDKPATPKATTPAQLQAMSPVMQMESQLKANQLEIKDEQAQLRGVEEKIREYENRLNQAPVREQQLTDLTRDYEQSKANYDSLLKKQMQSQMATNLEKRQQGQQFRILDPPSLPQKPFWPNRKLFSLAGVFGGLAFGLLMAVLVEFMDLRIRSEKDLQEFITAKVLVNIPHMIKPDEAVQQARRRRLEWAATAVILVVMAAGNAFSLLKG